MLKKEIKKENSNCALNVLIIKFSLVLSFGWKSICGQLDLNFTLLQLVL
jgi:hypothetical protein